MKFFGLFLLSLFSLVIAADDDKSFYSPTLGETYSITRTINNNGHVYTKTRVQVYSGQALTEPTSGTATTVFTVSASDRTYTKTMVVTYSKTTTFPEYATTDTNTSDDTHVITTTISKEFQTYTKTITGDKDHVSRQSTGGANFLAASVAGSMVGIMGLFLL